MVLASWSFLFLLYLISGFECLMTSQLLCQMKAEASGKGVGISPVCKDLPPMSMALVTLIINILVSLLNQRPVFSHFVKFHAL